MGAVFVLVLREVGVVGGGGPGGGGVELVAGVAGEEDAVGLGGGGGGWWFGVGVVVFGGGGFEEPAGPEGSVGVACGAEAVVLGGGAVDGETGSVGVGCTRVGELDGLPPVELDDAVVGDAPFEEEALVAEGDEEADCVSAVAPDAQEEYNDLEGPAPIAPSATQTEPPRHFEDDFLGSFEDDVEETFGWQEEVDKYLTEPIKRVVDIYAWWRDNAGRFPRLSTIAFDLLSIPAMSSECERVFSRAKLTITTQRHSLQDDAINMLECLKNWGGGGMV